MIALLEQLTPYQQAEIARFERDYGKPAAKRYLQVLAGQKPDPASPDEPEPDLSEVKNQTPKRKPRTPRTNIVKIPERGELMAGITHEDVITILSKIKPLNMVEVLGLPYLSTEQVALYYETSPWTIHSCVNRERRILTDEDGLKCLKGEDLFPFKQAFFCNRRVASLVVWPPRAVFRAGLMLRHSEVAIKLQETLAPNPARKRKSRHKTMSPQELKGAIRRYLGTDYYNKESMPALRIALAEIIADIDKVQGAENEQP